MFNFTFCLVLRDIYSLSGDKILDLSGLLIILIFSI